MCSSDLFDQIVSFYALSFVDHESFPFVWNAMFSLARNAVTICTEVISREHSDKLAELGKRNHLFDHTWAILDEAAVLPPSGWTLVYKQTEFCYKSLQTRADVHGIVVRFEKTLPDLNNNSEIDLNKIM